LDCIIISPIIGMEFIIHLPLHHKKERESKMNKRKKGKGKKKGKGLGLIRI